MSMPVSRRAASFLLGAMIAAAPLAPAHAEGDPRPPLSDMVSASKLSDMFGRIALMSARSLVDLTFDSIATDFYTDSMDINGLTIRPDAPWDVERACAVRVDKARFSGMDLMNLDMIRLHVEFLGVSAPPACLAPGMDGMAAAGGLETIAIDRIYFDVDYRISSSALRVEGHMTSPDLLALSFDVDFAYVAFKAEEEEPSLDLARAEIILEDLGFWAKAQQVLPPDAATPDAAAAFVTEALTQVFSPPGPDGSPGPAMQPDQAAFVASAAAAARSFVEAPGQLVLGTGLDRPIRLSPELGSDPAVAFKALNPAIGRAPAARRQILPAALIAQALADPSSLSDRERLRAGKALAAGLGTPKAAKAAQALLFPLADAGDMEAALILAETLIEADPKPAYRYALLAGAKGAVSAPGLLDRLETRLATPVVLEMQASSLPADATPEVVQGYAPIEAVRRRALAYLRGQGEARNYRAAYFWGTIGAAAGDRASASVVAQIDRRMRYRGAVAASSWAEASDTATGAALALWLKADYPARLQGPPPPFLDVAGSWDTTEGSMTLTQDGASVAGRYATGSGEIVGVMEGGILVGIWTQDSAGERCATARDGRHFWGRLRFEFAEDRFKGNWSYCDGPLTPEATWSGTRAR